jgi:D-aspartate ligase
VLKRSDPWLASFDPSAPSVLIAHSASELVDGYRRMESSVRPQVIIQEYIPGDTETIWMFNGYFNRNSECLCAFTGQKLRQRGPGTGPTTLGVCTWNQEVGDAATSLMREVGYHGIVDMGFRYDERDGRYKLLDVNPRLGSTFRLFVGENGVDVLRAAYLDLTGQRVPFTRAPNGRRWLAEPYDIVAAAQLVGQRQLRPSAWLRSLGDVAELAWWARDDPLPFLAMIASLPPQGWRYRTRRRARLRSTALAGLKPASSQPTSGASR